MNIRNSVALVTGTNRGIGKALVQQLIQTGAKKIYTLTRGSSTLKIDGGQTEIVPIQCDVSDMDSVQSLATQAKDVNLLINNAGVLSMGNILEVSMETIKHDFDTNFYGALSVSKVMVPIIQNNGGGSIINMLTLLSLASMPGFSAYNASKAAAWSMTLSLRASLAKTNIDVHSVFPGAVDTDMLDGIDIPKTSPVEIAQAIIDGVNAGKEDIFPDPMSKEVYAAWNVDHKNIEKQFASM